MEKRENSELVFTCKIHNSNEDHYPDEIMAKKKIAISVDEGLLNIIDEQRGNEKRSTHINSIIANHYKAVPEDKGGGTFVTTLELRKTLKPIYDKLLILEGLSHDVKALEEIISIKKEI
jgi:hypothetical protein